jgi:hypothetical protein
MCAAADRSAIHFQRLMRRLLMPHDLPQVAPINRLATHRAPVEMVALVVGLFPTQTADDRRS